jgi:hypothetical protein
MPRVVKRSAAQAVKAGPSRRSQLTPRFLSSSLRSFLSLSKSLLRGLNGYMRSSWTASAWRRE